MNAQTKKAAVTKYSKLHAAGASQQEVIDALKEAKFSENEAQEIYDEISAGNAPAPQESPVAEKKEGLLKFEKWAAAPVFKYRVNEDTGEKERYLEKIEKKSNGPLSVHHIEQRHADELNSQLENSGFYYFVK